MEKGRQLCVVSSAAFPRCQPVELQVCGSALDLQVRGSACGATGVCVSALDLQVCGSALDIQVCGSALDLQVCGSACGTTGVWVSLWSYRYVGRPVELQVCGSALDLPVYGSACVPGPTGVWVSAGGRSLNQSEDHAGLTMVRTKISEWCDV